MPNHFVVAVLALLVLTSDARAATVSFEHEVLVFAGEGAETNHLSVDQGETTVLRDEAAVIRVDRSAAQLCDSLDDHRVVCSGMWRVEAALGAGDDRGIVQGGRLDGGDGADDLTGGLVAGGPGDDVVSGTDGNDRGPAARGATVSRATAATTSCSTGTLSHPATCTTADPDRTGSCTASTRRTRPGPGRCGSIFARDPLAPRARTTR